MNESGETSALASGLVTKYSSPKSKVQLMKHKVLTFYLYAGLSPAICGGFGGLMWLVQVAGLSPSVTTALNTPLGIGFSVTILGTYLWLLMTPVALISLLRRRNFKSLIPIAIYLSWCGADLIMANLPWVPPNLREWVITLSFVPMAVFAVKHQLRLIREVEDEAVIVQPKLLGCGGDAHELRPAIADSNEGEQQTGRLPAP